MFANEIPFVCATNTGDGSLSCGVQHGDSHIPVVLPKNDLKSDD